MAVLTGIPPWLVPPDFITAMSKGASAGLERARIDTEGNDAAGKLRLGYAQLAAEQSEAAQRLAAAQAQQNAAMALREQGLTDTNQYRTGELQLGQQRESDATDKTAQTEADKAKALSEKESAAKLLHVGNSLYQFQDGKLTPLVESKAAPDWFAQQDRRDAGKRVSDARAMLSKASSEDDKGKAATELADSIRALMKVKSPTSAPSPEPALKEGQVVRNKKTGQLGTVINGVIVPDDPNEGDKPAEDNPYADQGLPVSRGFMYSGQNAEVPAQ